MRCTFLAFIIMPFYWICIKPTKALCIKWKWVIYVKIKLRDAKDSKNHMIETTFWAQAQQLLSLDILNVWVTIVQFCKLAWSIFVLLYVTHLASKVFGYVEAETQSRVTGIKNWGMQFVCYSRKPCEQCYRVTLFYAFRMIQIMQK